MKEDLTAKQREDAFSLTPEGMVELLQIDLPTGQTSLRFSKHRELRYLGATWESVPFNLTEMGVNTQGEAKRPKLSIPNPDGAFSAWIAQGAADSALVTRYRVLQSDLEAGVSAFQRRVWRISKPLSLSKSLVVFELRSPLDGQMFVLPGRAFYPPEFSHVSL